MEIYTYLLYSGSILGLLSLFYWLILRKETFFQANRGILIGNIILALLIPLIPAPKSVSQLKQDLILSFVKEQNMGVSPKQPNTTGETTLLLVDSTVLNEAIPIQQPKEEVSNLNTIPFTKFTLLKWVYLIGIIIMLFRFVIQVFYVYRQIEQSEITKGAGYYLAANNKNISPFSFWKYIVVNPNIYDEPSFLHILEHERIHVLQKHTIDLVLAELFLIIQWCNPFAWWHRHWVDQNLEFLVDQTLLDNGENKKSYQYHLVQVAVPNSPLSISSNYNSSQLKKRIKMMNLQRSSIAAIWKYALLLPIAFLLLVGFTTTKHEIESTTKPIATEFKKAPSSSYVIITEDASEKDLKALQEELYEFGYVLSFDHLSFDNNKITEMDALLDYNDSRGLKIPEKWEKDELSPKVSLFVNEDFGRFGHFEQNEIIFEDLENNIPKEQIFIAGDFSLASVLKKLRAQFKAYQKIKNLQFQKDVKDPNWKGKLTKMGSVYGPVITITNIEHIKDLIQKKGYPTTYYLDGIQNDKSALDIPLMEIEKIEFNELRYRKFDESGKYLNATPWNYEVKIKRKGKQKSAPSELNINELEEIYIILTEESSLDKLGAIQTELSKYDLELSINNLLYNEADKIVNIKVELKENGITKATHSWNKESQGYKFMVLFRNFKNAKTGVGNNKELLMNAVKKNENRKTVVFDNNNQNSDETIKFLLKEIKKTNEQKTYGERITKVKQKPQRKGFHYFKACDCYIPKTFSPSTPDAVFKIEGIDLNKKSSFHLYNKWGKEVYKAEPYRNDWKGLDKYGEKMKLGVYYFTFQADESLVVVNEFIKLIDESKKETPKQRKGFHYFKACDCYIPKTFSPSTPGAVFKIEGIDLNKKSSFHLYNNNNHLIFKAEPYQNDWKGFTMFGEKINLGTYYFTFQAAEGMEVVNGSLNVVDEALAKQLENATDFIHTPNLAHYVITQTTQEDLKATADFIKTSLFMMGLKPYRYSNIFLGDNKTKPLFIIRRFENFQNAQNIAKSLNQFSSKPKSLHFMSINKTNYQMVLKQKSLVKYEEFYKKLISGN